MPVLSNCVGRYKLLLGLFAVDFITSLQKLINIFDTVGHTSWQQEGRLATNTVQQ